MPHYRSQEWNLFIDSLKRSLNCVLLHNSNRYASLPIGHLTKLKKNCNNVKMVLEKLDHDFHQWLICTDLKMVIFLLGQKNGNAKYPCFICLRDSQARDDHLVKKGWSSRDSIQVGEASVIRKLLFAREKKLLFPTAYQNWFDETVCESLSCYWGLL